MGNGPSRLNTATTLSRNHMARPSGLNGLQKIFPSGPGVSQSRPISIIVTGMPRSVRRRAVTALP